MEKDLIRIDKCQIRKGGSVLIPQIDWTMKEGEAWLVTGPNGGGKADFIKALSGSLEFYPEQGGSFYSEFAKSTAVVSLEEAARLIEIGRAHV